MAAYKTSLSPAELATLTFIYAIGSTLLHSAACVINDICDRDLDRQVGEC
jgi:4-hydroxybenzoate polyprenyltransferase